MAENFEGVITPTGAPASLAQGDVPEAVRRRYLTEGRGAQLAYYTDQTTKQPAFQDAGRRLMADRASPAVIKDMLAIAEHRGWSQVRVGGSVEFRREAWMQAQARGLEVDGYKPTNRDRQALERRVASPGREAPAEPAAKSAPDLNPRPKQDRGVTGELIETGVAAYKYQRDAERSPFIKLRLETGRVQTVWGVDLPAALEHGGARIGDNVTVRRTGVDQVLKTVRETDRKTGEVHRERKEVPRNRWEIVAARLREAAPQQAARDPELRGAQSLMAAIETVVRGRAESAAAERIIGTARERIAGWLERGARFEPAMVARQSKDVSRDRQRDRTR
jgi:hypothetical protein